MSIFDFLEYTNKTMDEVYSSLKKVGEDTLLKLKDKKSHIEQIRCPVCNLIQNAEVLHTEPWWSYAHECIKCGYVITESEWEVEEDIKCQS